MFELDERVRRLRETLAYLRDATLADAAAIKNDAKAHGDWAKFISELRELMSAAETLAPRRKAAKAKRPAVREPAGARALAEAFRAGATLH